MHEYKYVGNTVGGISKKIALCVAREDRMYMYILTDNGNNQNDGKFHFFLRLNK